MTEDRNPALHVLPCPAVQPQGVMQQQPGQLDGGNRQPEPDQRQAQAHAPLAILAVPGGFSAVCLRHELAYGHSTDMADLRGFVCEVCEAEAGASRARARFLALVLWAIKQEGLRHG